MSHQGRALSSVFEVRMLTIRIQIPSSGIQGLAGTDDRSHQPLL